MGQTLHFDEFDEGRVGSARYPGAPVSGPEVSIVIVRDERGPAYFAIC